MPHPEPLCVIVLMGVSGAGKTTVGRQLADELGWRFYDGDDFHAPENVEKMRRQIPLTDADRIPWLQTLHDHIADCLRERRCAIVACSALRQHYRDILIRGLNGAVLVYLKGSYALIERRLGARRGHYMPPGLLQSQFAALEEPGDVLTVGIDRPPAAIVEAIRAALGV
jgi:gluconokinase